MEKAPRPDAVAAPAPQAHPLRQLPESWPRLPAGADGAKALAAAEAHAAQAVVAVWAAGGTADSRAGADMPRPFCKRFVGWQPGVSLFKPAGIPAGELELVVLSLDEVEALRLADLNGEYQEAAAERMKISRATFARIVESARRKVADALVHGKALQIQTEPGAQPPAPAKAPGECHRRGCGCKGHGQGRGRFVEYPAPKEEPK